MTKTCPFRWNAYANKPVECNTTECGVWSTERNCCGRIIPAPQSTPFYIPYNVPSNRPDDVWYKNGEIICKTNDVIL